MLLYEILNEAVGCNLSKGISEDDNFILDSLMY